MKTPKLRLPGKAELVDGGVMMLLTSLAVLAFQSSYGGFHFLVLGSVAALLGIALAFFAVAHRWPLPVAIAAAIVVYAVVGGAAALPERAIGGVFPSPASTMAALRSIITGWKELITTAPPVGRTGDLMVLPFLGGFAAALVAYLVARKLKAAVFALLPPAVLLGVGIASGTDKPVSLVLNGCVFGAIAAGWLAFREHSRRPLLEGGHASRRRLATGVGVLTLASVVGFAAAGSLPFAQAEGRTIWRQTVTPPFDPLQYPSPLSGYRRYVKEASLKNETMFTIEGLPDGVPVRLATMDAYDGLVWQVTGGAAEDPSLNDSGSFERVGASLEPDYEGQMATVTVVIGKYNDVWIPDVGEVRSLEFSGSTGGPGRDRQLADAYRYNRATDTAASRFRLREGDRYVMEVRLPVMMDTLAGAQVIPTQPRLGQTMVVPEIAQQLQAYVLSIKDTGAQLDTMRQLMSEGTYSDGDRNSSPPQQGSRAGHSSYRLREFVGRYPKLPLIGNAEQYAATYALVFRDLGRLPTRVVMGFLPSESSTNGPVAVLAREIEAWVEVPIKDVGWVAIFPTPPRDQLALTASAEQQPEPDYRTQNPPPPPLIDPEFESSATGTGKAKATKETEPPEPAAIDESGGSFLSGPFGVVAKVVGLPVGLLLSAAGVVVLLKTRRRRRRRTEGAAHVRIASGWREVTDLALDMGHPVPSTTTRREAAAFVGAGTSHLASRADEAVWGDSEPSDADVAQYWAELSSTLDAMRSELGVFDRFKAAVSLRSLKVGRRLRRPGRSQ